MEMLDLLIIGAGWRGISMAKTYHQVHPNASIMILDEAETIGGVWAEERVYPGLHTNNPLGTYEFSDFPMTPAIAGCNPFEPIPGMGVHRYLCEAAKHFDIERYFHLGWTVKSARLQDDDCWEVKYVSSKDASQSRATLAKKMVVATGLASAPYMPSLAGQDYFKGLIMHSKQLKYRAKELVKARNVIVLGGNKSAYDVCYSVAQNGGTARMVLRPSGGGPSFQWPGSTPLFGSMTPIPVRSAVRIYTLFDPWPFSTHGSWIRGFLHRWTIGLKITRTFWSKVTGVYTERLKGGEGTKKLIPWTSTYWMGTSLGMLNYPADWLQLVREGRIVVHHADVTSLGSTSVELTDCIVKDIDAIVCCTGWRCIPPFDFLPESLELGLTCVPQEVDDEAVLIERARRYILQQRPFLKDPARNVDGNEERIAGEMDGTPCRLYRYMAPPCERFLKSRNLAFIAADNPLHFAAAAQIQALWTTAFLDGKILHLIADQLDVAKVRKDTVMLTEYERLRRPKIAGGVGEKYGEFVFDCLPYFDMLLQDLELRTRRKASLWKEWFEPYGLDDFKGLVEEWLNCQTSSPKD